MTTWTVLATGPSLRRVQQHNLALGPVVAINLAVLSPLRVDFWSALDHPAKFEQVYAHRVLTDRCNLPVLWCREGTVARWHELGVRTWAYPETEVAFRAQNLPASRRPQFACFHLTILATLARCAGLGAKKIEVWGCDMAGRAHAYGTDPDNRSVPVWDGRWKDEPRALEAAIAELEEQGCDVVLRQPG